MSDLQTQLKQAIHYAPDTGVFTRTARTSNRINIGDKAGTVGAYGYVRFHIFGKLYPAHRVAWLYMTGAWPDGEIDHINGDKTDNRFANLRLATRRLNMENQRRAKGRVGTLGVSMQKGRYRAQIQTADGKKHLGMFATLPEAYAAYVAAKRKLHEGCTL